MVFGLDMSIYDRGGRLTQEQELIGDGKSYLCGAIPLSPQHLCSTAVVRRERETTPSFIRSILKPSIPFSSQNCLSSLLAFF
jgi:hypothetical protein